MHNSSSNILKHEENSIGMQLVLYFTGKVMGSGPGRKYAVFQGGNWWDKQFQMNDNKGTFRQWRIEGAEGASRHEQHFRRGGTFGRNVKIYVKNVKEGEIFRRNGQRSWKLGAAQVQRGRQRVRHNSVNVKLRVGCVLVELFSAEDKKNSWKDGIWGRRPRRHLWSVRHCPTDIEALLFTLPCLFFSVVIIIFVYWRRPDVRPNKDKITKDYMKINQ